MTPYSVKTFAIKIKEKPHTDRAGTPVALEYDKRVTTPCGDFTKAEFGKGISIPEELFEKTAVCGGIEFKMGNKGRKNAVVCRGQKIKMPAKANKVFILAASADKDRIATFAAGKAKVKFSVPDFSENVGGWDQVAAGDKAFIKRETVGISYSHTHDKDGDRLYKFANVFMYEIDLNGARTVTLPKDGNIIVLAVTAAHNGVYDAKPAQPLYDTVK